MTIHQHITNSLVREQTPFRIYPDGKGYYIEDDMLIPRKKFEDKYPLASTFTLSKNISCDGTKRWLRDDIKSPK